MYKAWIFLRSITFITLQWVTTLYIATMGGLLMLLRVPPKHRYPVMNLWGKFAIFMLRWICGIKTQVIGKENIPDKNCLIMAKHQSAWETIYFQFHFGYLAFVVKRELLWVPIFGLGLKASNPIAIDRNAGKKALKQLMEEGQQRLEDGAWVCIFPEGTRTAPGQPGKYNIGGAMLAAKTGCMVLPIAHNAGSLWPKNSLLKYPGTVTVVIGEPFSAEGMKPAEINAKVETWIEATMKEIQPMEPKA